MEPQMTTDFFDIPNLKQTFPKVTINMLGNLHQAKTIKVITEGINAVSGEPENITQKEVLHQDNIFEIEMKIESDVEGGIDIEHDCIHGHL